MIFIYSKARLVKGQEFAFSVIIYSKVGPVRQWFCNHHMLMGVLNGCGRSFQKRQRKREISTGHTVLQKKKGIFGVVLNILKGSLFLLPC